ncbi:FAD-dependent oxidoreductase [Plantactinospora sp. KBS50]|uniref:FAD-dependent oxidoreductase n=1 Tax=Plantactinospora sp. KBS50 TaxID=2024580 RepID=UPI000BAAFD3E|nr:FAD-dependent oxidoreductase [Plantactinospora sp. KBS50]ASW54611.1 oxygenase [Plantactinospora sp. KBS50]
MSEPIDVLVAGAGPVGLTAAYELARRGLRIRVVDAASGPATTSRAIATHPRTLETYDQMGLADRMIARGLVVQAFTMYSNGRRLARLDADYTEIPTRFPFTLAIDQVFTEEVLRGALAELGVAVEWGSRLEAFSQHDAGVRASVRTTGPAGGTDGGGPATGGTDGGGPAEPAGATELIEAGWLVGCDGGHSLVRKLLGLPLIGEANETWLIADAQVDTELPRNSIYWIRSGSGTMMMAPLPGERRWRMLDTVEVDYDGDAAVIAERFSRKLSAGTGTPVSAHAPGWVSVFTAQQRMVPAMRRDRVFVAGDAAHVHSPASGQGMNTGIQEAYNLGWKLAQVVRGEAGAQLLDSYSAERVPIGRELLGSTKRATALVALKNRLAGLALPVVFGIVQRVPALRVRGQRTALGRVSGLKLGYPDGPLTSPGGTVPAAPAAGERVVRVHPDEAASPGWRALLAQLRDLRWTLLAFGPDAVAEAGRLGAPDWLSVRTVSGPAGTGPAGTGAASIVPVGTGAASIVPAGPDAAGPGEPVPLADPDGTLATTLGCADGGWLLIRPDGYLAARGTVLTGDAVEAALRPAGPIRPVPVPTS